MTDFKVEPAALRSAASVYDDAASEMDAVAAAISEPDSMMMGVFLSPLVALFGPLVTAGARNLLTGVGQMDTAYGKNLRGTAKAYETTEDQAVEAARAMLEVD